MGGGFAVQIRPVLLFPSEKPRKCKLTHTVEIGLHTQFIGQIMDTKIEESVLDEKNIPDIKKINPILMLLCFKSPVA